MCHCADGHVCSQCWKTVHLNTGLTHDSHSNFCAGPTSMVTTSQPYTDRCWCVTASQLPVAVLSASCQSLYCQWPDMSVGQLPAAVLSADWHVSQPAASRCAASSLENRHQHLTLIQDGYQCSTTSCSVLFLPWWQSWLWWYMISVEYTMWNHGELIWCKWENICSAMEKSASVISSVACCSSIDIHDKW